MQEVVENHKAIAKSRHLALKTQFDPAIDRLSRVYESDRARLNQIIANFVRFSTPCTPVYTFPFSMDLD